MAKQGIVIRNSVNMVGIFQSNLFTININGDEIPLAEILARFDGKEVKLSVSETMEVDG